MNLRTVSYIVILTYLWVMMILLGSIVLETFMVYPNVFYNPPESLATGMEFMKIRAPNDFFPPLGLTSWIAGLGSVILGWRVKSARYWILASLLMIVAEGAFSMAFFWPRNAIMFVEGSAVHSADFLRQTAQEFQNLHWGRLVFNVLSAAFIFVGFLRFYRHDLLSEPEANPLRQAHAAL